MYISDTAVILKQCQGRKTYNDNADPEQGSKHAKFDRPRFYSVHEKGNVNFFSNQ